ncbi:unnamed protein product, partial [Didymodactylos carnosus]
MPHNYINIREPSKQYVNRESSSPAHLALTSDQRNHYKTATRKASRNEQLRQQYDAFDVPKSQY